MRGIIQSLKEKIGLAFYLHSQTYTVTSEIILKNISGSSKDFALVVALPRDGDSQKVISGPEIFPNHQIQRDSLYGNPYTVFSGTAAQEENFIFQFNSVVEVMPRPIHPTGTFTLTDYNRLDSGFVQKWLAPSPHIDTRDPRLLKLVDEAKRRASDVWSILKNVNEYVISLLEYGNPILGLYSVDDVLEKKTVDCGGYDVLFMALIRELGIPCRLVSGFWAGYHNNVMHAWVEVLLPDGQWLPVDPSVEALARAGRTMKGGRLGFVGSNRLVFSYGADIPIEVDEKKIIVDMLQNPTLAERAMQSQFEITQTVITKRV